MIRKLLIIPPILIGIAVLYFMASGRQAPERHPPKEQSRAVRVITAQPVRFVPKVTGFGSVYPGTVWSAIAQVSGEVTYVHPELDNGVILAGGTEIIRIATSDYDLAISQAQANIRSGEAKLSELQITETNTKDLLEIEKRGLDLRESELARKQDLLARGTVAQSALELAQRETLAQRKKVQDLENTLRLLPTQRTVQREQIAIYRAQLESAKLNLARTSITLPFDARIADVNVEIEQFVSTGGTLMTADGIDVAEVEAQIPISRFRDMVRASMPEGLVRSVPDVFTAQSLAQVIEKIGFEATVRLRAGSEFVEWPARFARISDEVDPKTRTIGVIVAVDGAFAKAVPGKRPPLGKGMFVEIDIRARAAENQIIVPRAAFHNGRIYVVDGEGRLDIRSVTVGLQQDDFAVIDEGVAPGEQVVVSDLIPAVAGMLLTPQPDDLLQTRLKDDAAGGVPRP